MAFSTAHGLSADGVWLIQKLFVKSEHCGDIKVDPFLIQREKLAASKKAIDDAIDCLVDQNSYQTLADVKSCTKLSAGFVEKLRHLRSLVIAHKHSLKKEKLSEAALDGYFRHVADPAIEAVFERMFGIFSDFAQQEGLNSLGKDFPTYVWSLVVFHKLFKKELVECVAICTNRDAKREELVVSDRLQQKMDEAYASICRLEGALEYQRRFFKTSWTCLSKRGPARLQPIKELGLEVTQEIEKAEANGRGAAAENLLAPIGDLCRVFFELRKGSSTSGPFALPWCADICSKQLRGDEVSEADLELVASDERCFTRAVKTLDRLFCPNNGSRRPDGCEELQECLTAAEADGPFNHATAIMWLRERLVQAAEQCRLASRLASNDDELLQLEDQFTDGHGFQSSPYYYRGALGSLLDKYRDMMQDYNVLHSRNGGGDYKCHLLMRIHHLETLGAKYGRRAPLAREPGNGACRFAC